MEKALRQRIRCRRAPCAVPPLGRIVVDCCSSSSSSAYSIQYPAQEKLLGTQAVGTAEQRGQGGQANATGEASERVGERMCAASANVEQRATVTHAHTHAHSVYGAGLASAFGCIGVQCSSLVSFRFVSFVEATTTPTATLTTPTFDRAFPPLASARSANCPLAVRCFAQQQEQREVRSV